MGILPVLSICTCGNAIWPKGMTSTCINDYPMFLEDVASVDHLIVSVPSTSKNLAIHSSMVWFARPYCNQKLWDHPFWEIPKSISREINKKISRFSCVDVAPMFLRMQSPWVDSLLDLLTSTLFTYKYKPFHLIFIVYFLKST